MRTEELSKLLIFGNNKDKKELISRLQHLGVMHIHKANPQEKLIQDLPMKGVDQMSHLLLKLQYIATQTGIGTSFTLEGLPPVEKVISKAEEFVEKHFEKVEALSNEKKKVQKEIAKFKAQQNAIKKIPFSLHSTVPHGHVRIVLKSEEDIRDYPFPVKIKLQKSEKAKNQHYTEIFIMEKDKRKFDNALRKSRSKQVNLPKMPLGSAQHLQSMDRKQAESEKKLKSIEKEIFKKINGKQSKIKFLITSLENYREQANISQKFLHSDNFFAIEGFVKTKDVLRVKNSFPETSIFAEPAGENAPSKLKNTGFAKNFEKITTMFGIPSYSLIDPTPLVSFFFPFFFGFMLSDVGYGLLLLIAIIAIFFHIGEKFKKILVVLGASAISSIFFGLLFGSFFGNLVEISPLYQDSFSSSFMILKVSLVIGLIHINLGVLLKIYQEIIKKTPVLKALQVILPIPMIQGVVAMLVFKQYILAAVTTVILLGILIREKGFFGIMDITGFFGMWFSYARLLALSLATAGVALAVNIIAEKALSFGKIGFILWIGIISFGHLFNFVLNILGCAIHSARLHYVEFFSLFFEGEGYSFKEFKVQRQMTKAEE